MSFSINNITVKDELPLIPLKNVVLFPRVAIPLLVQRPKSLDALSAAMNEDRLALFVAQKNQNDDVGAHDIYSVGTVGKIFEVHRLPDGSSKVDVEGIARVYISNIDGKASYFKGQVTPLHSPSSDMTEVEPLVRATVDQFKSLIEMRNAPTMFPDLMHVLNQIKDPFQVVSMVAINLNLEVKDQQGILEISDAQEALKKVTFYIMREIEILDAERRVVRETRKQIGKMQKEVFLREQMKSIEKELGVDGEKGEFEQLRQKIEAAKMPKDVHEKAMKELGRLEKMSSFSPEASYVRTYIDWLIDIPWSKKDESKIDLKAAEKILDEDHYGLKKAKERIVEYLAVQKQVGKIKGPILCFAGPPGVGKTSIGKSIARAMGRKFVRISLGGIRDEAEIRGHRRTYVGALPGRMIQGMNTAGTTNPVFMLDEIDKIGADFRGDPSAALLEALDPEQNNAFSDHYLEVPYDLSDVLFIATANMLETIPPALRDRMEIIEFAGYTELEKLNIAKKFLVPKVVESHGLKSTSVGVSDAAIKDVITKHTREAGVRDLERQLSTIIRKVTRQMVEKKSKKKTAVTPKNLHTYLGPVKFTHQMAEEKDEVGVVTGLAWTPVGGEVLTIEATKMPGKGKVTLTGQLGNVMKESVHAALSFARNYAAKVNGKEDFYETDMHVHVPSGSIKKDGPSAGVAMVTALVSLLTQKKVRRDVAMTGEVTLRGKVLAIGGVKEKVLAAHRAGIKTVILPKENKKDMEEDIPQEIKKDLKFVFVKNVDEVLKVAIK